MCHNITTLPHDTPQIIERIRKEYTSNPDFTPANAAKAASAAEGLCKCVRVAAAGFVAPGFLFQLRTVWQQLCLPSQGHCAVLGCCCAAYDCVWLCGCWGCVELMLCVERAAGHAFLMAGRM